MKYTNIKKLLIKFMGGGLINFPTRFLRWIKIDGDAEGDDGGDGGDSESSNVFFSPVGIQPTHIVVETDDDTYPIIEIKDFTIPGDIGNGYLLYSKEDLVSIGVNENDLNNLEIVSYNEMLEDEAGQKGFTDDYIDNIIDENYVIGFVNCDDNSCRLYRVIIDYNQVPIIYRFGDNLYTFNLLQDLI